MEEEETVAEFHAKLFDISNESYALGKTYSNAKILGVLPRKFMSKVTSIEEMRNVEELDLDELIGSLQNYELSLTRWKKGKKQKDPEKEKADNSLAFVHKEEKKLISGASEGFTDETLALLTENYAKFLKKNYKKNFPGGKENGLRRNFGGINKQTQQFGDEKNRGIRCRECDGFGHIQAECANTLKKKKALAATWSDSDEEKSSTSSDKSDEEKQVVAFVAKSHQSMCSEKDENSSSTDEDSDGRQHAYDEMFAQWEYMAKKIKGLTSAKQQLESEKDELEDTVKKLTKQLDGKDSEIYKLTAELIRAKQSLEFIPPRTAAINHTLQLQKPYGDRTSIGYKILYKKWENLGINDPSLSKNKEDKTPDDSVHNTFSAGFPNSTKQISVSSGPTKLNFEGRKPILNGQIHQERFVPVCHFCNKRGHIRPRCYKLQAYLKAMIDRPNSFPQLNRFTGRLSSSEGRPKSDLNESVALVAHTSLSTFQEDQWYFDSGCSRHLTGNRNVLVNYKGGKEGAVTFGDGNKGQIFGKGDLVLNGVAPLTEVLYVKGLKANLISISQLCDNDFTVNFSKTHCFVVTNGCSVLTDDRTSDNCYALSNQVVCNRSFLDKPDLWHYRLGHLNFRDLKRIVKLQAVRGIPEMKVTRDRLCGPCQLGKQTKASHPPVNMLLTSRVLELIHMDLMGPMQNESLSGKRFVMVLVDDYSSDHGKEFENTVFSDFCDQLGIKHEFSAPKTPQQNGVFERKNRTLQEMARVMMHAKNISKRFWAEAINTACYICNRVHLRTGTTQTAYELWKGRTPNVSHMHIFGCVCYVLNDREHLGKFDPRSDEGVFLGYSLKGWRQ
ncbi:uncharacterized protein LOC133832644 [Humulus lupulus]|uniref:uncharacterized protein LOC133832644 n=1 Tax=Humulus lupulus TaxID=3486 RepID=UPI002B40F7CA|nr:uncharacterized protein LOC133832644 [Humulus lupulus]